MTTGQVRKEIDSKLPMHRLQYLINSGQIVLQKDSLGHYIWTPKDVAKARELLKKHG